MVIGEVIRCLFEESLTSSDQKSLYSVIQFCVMSEKCSSDLAAARIWETDLTAYVCAVAKRVAKLAENF